MASTKSKSPTPVVYEYATCSTCKKALAYLRDAGVEAKTIPIATQAPSAETLMSWFAKSGLPAKKFFNTSGQSYRALVSDKGKDWVAARNDAQIAALLSKDGKMIKRPIALIGARVLVGFRQDEWAAALAGR